MEIKDLLFYSDGRSRLKNLKMESILGHGEYGTVFLATIESSQGLKQFAVKQMKVTDPTKKLQFEDSFKKVTAALIQLSHERIVQYYGYNCTDLTYHIFIEYMPGGSLSEFIAKNISIEEEKARQLTQQMLEGIAYIHGEKLFHRDIKSSNVLMLDENTVKLADFGLTREYEELTVSCTEGKGTCRFMAPEMFQKRYNKYVDIWALGCVVLHMLTGQIPFPKLEQQQVLYKLMRKSSPMDYGSFDLSKNAKSFLEKTFQLKPKSRPSAESLLNDPFIVANHCDTKPSGSFKTSIRNVFRRKPPNSEDLLDPLGCVQTAYQSSPGGDAVVHSEERSKKRLTEINVDPELQQDIYKEVTEKTEKMLLEGESRLDPIKTATYSPDIHKAPTSIDEEAFNKHPCHEDFINIASFKKEHLPACYREHDEMYKLIKALAKITVKVERTQSQEMEYALNSPYIVTGSGKIETVTKKEGSNQCSCDKCKTFSEIKFGEITILTSARLTDKDAKLIKCIFFFDDDHTSDQIKWLKGDKVVVHNSDKDICMFTCVTCDMNLVEKLAEDLANFGKCWEDAFDRYEQAKWEEEKLVIIVSHPYGCKKHVSIGKKYIDNEKKNMSYTAPVCPGCSGAYVLIPDFNIVDDIVINNFI